ncbi:MAG: hypothetical protein NVS9B3_05140 [Gemmatimonadaceae bacterium]
MTSVARSIHAVCSGVLAVALLASTAVAQGTLSAQGLGYPLGQLSTRARGTAGAVAEFDALSPLNPASLSSIARSTLYFQYEPEFRSVGVGAGSTRTTTLRFPLTMAAIPFGERYVVGFAVSTLVDRTGATQFTARDAFGPADTVSSTQTFRTTGAINDIRLAGSMRLGMRAQAGIGVHVYSGQNRVILSREFASAGFAPFGDTTRLDYGGSALSIGGQLRLPGGLALALDARRGGGLTMREADSVRASGHVPDRVAAGVLIDAIPGATIAVRYAWEGWSAVQSLGRGPFAADTRDMSVGADVAGPRLGRWPLLLRGGLRSRELPFSARGQRVTERSLVGGVGVPVADQRASLDISVERASRSGVSGVRETGTILSLGIAVRP